MSGEEGRRLQIVRQRFATHDRDRAHARLAGLYTAFRPRPHGVEQPFAYRDSSARVGPLMSHRAQYSSAVDFSFPAHPQVILVHVLEGSFQLPVGDDAAAVVGPGSTYLCPVTGFDGAMDGIHTLSLTLPLGAVRAAAEVAAATEGLATTGLRLGTAVGQVVGGRSGRAWAATLEALHRQLMPEHSPLGRPVLLAETVRRLSAAVVASFPALVEPSGRSEPRTGTLPPVVHRAMRFMDDNADRPITQAQVAEAAGVGVRALQLAFRKHLDTTPQRYLRRVRLAHAHHDLRVADPGRTTVADVAARWGFLHAGRFSRYHHEEFGSWPSTTLTS
jgi:AraC-like DNA-binding protein